MNKLVDFAANHPAEPFPPYDVDRHEDKNKNPRYNLRRAGAIGAVVVGMAFATGTADEAIQPVKDGVNRFLGAEDLNPPIQQGVNPNEIVSRGQQ